MKKIVLILAVLLFVSCKTKNINHIVYYNKANAIDSVFRFQKDTMGTIKNYKKLFRKYGAHNQERMREFETYIMLSHLKNKKFGGKKSLYKLINFITPYKIWYKDYSFFTYYKIDSLEVVRRIKLREQKYNKILNHSFQVAYYRDQHFRKDGYDGLTKINDLKNIQLMKWTLQKYGFPSPEKIGPLKTGYEDIVFVLLAHVSTYEAYHFYKKELYKYVMSGECNPKHYAMMIDRHIAFQMESTKSDYGSKVNSNEPLPYDTLRIDKNRKLLGLMGMKHYSKVPKDMKQILVIK